LRMVAEANQIYELLEDEITEIYYDYSGNGFSEAWVKRMKHAIMTVGKGFNMHRMLRDYYRKFYLPEITDLTQVESDDYAFLKKLTSDLKELKSKWSEIYVKDVITDMNQTDLSSGNEIHVDAYVHLGSCHDEKLVIELIYMVSGGQFETKTLDFIERYEDKIAKFHGKLVLKGHGVQGLNVRVRPSSDALYEAYPGLVKYFY